MFAADDMMPTSCREVECETVENVDTAETKESESHWGSVLDESRHVED